MFSQIIAQVRRGVESGLQFVQQINQCLDQTQHDGGSRKCALASAADGAAAQRETSEADGRRSLVAGAAGKSGAAVEPSLSDYPARYAPALASRPIHLAVAAQKPSQDSTPVNPGQHGSPDHTSAA